jgi:hypothetical protein
MAKLQDVTGLDPVAATRRLWDTYHPHAVWIPFAVIGVVAAIGLWIFGRMARRRSDMNAEPEAGDFGLAKEEAGGVTEVRVGSGDLAAILLSIFCRFGNSLPPER